jgi:hypothetical protein
MGRERPSVFSRRIIVRGEKIARLGIDPEVGVDESRTMSDGFGITENGPRIEDRRLLELDPEVGRRLDVVPHPTQGGRNEGQKKEGGEDDRESPHYAPRILRIAARTPAPRMNPITATPPIMRSRSRRIPSIFSECESRRSIICWTFVGDITRSPLR